MKIAFFVQHFLYGGVENALCALTDNLIKDGYEIVIYLIVGGGEYLKKLPEGVEVKEVVLPKRIKNNLQIGGTKFAVQQKIREKSYLTALQFIAKRVFYKKEFSELLIDFNQIPRITQEYDVAVCFHLHSPFLVRFVAEKVLATKKIAWIHNDFYSVRYQIKKLQKYLENYQYFISVSKQVYQEFITILPEYQNKTKVVHNLIDKEEILKLAEEENATELIAENRFKILSIGRLENQKGFDLAIEICKELRKRNIDFVWFVLGEGSERKKLEKMISQLHLKGVFCLLGNRVNPYPYLKGCDLYIQPSRHEGYGIAVAEARVFGKPIICTPFSGAEEQLKHGYNGSIVPFDKQKLAEEVERLLRNPQTRYKYKKNLEHEEWNCGDHDYDTFKELISS